MGTEIIIPSSFKNSCLDFINTAEFDLNIYMVQFISYIFLHQVQFLKS